MRLTSQILFTLALSLAACHRARVEAPFSTNRTIRERQHFFFLGFIGDYNVDVRKMCSNGVASFGEETRPSDILFSLVSVGIYTPRTVIVKCAG